MSALFIYRGLRLAKRQCTRNYKIREIRRAVRVALGVGPRSYIAPDTVEQWIGISRDEADRMKPSGAAFIRNRFPLLERRLSRQDCARWLERRYNRQVPKSACVYCAYQSNRQWAEKSPADFAAAVAVDEQLRSPENVARFRGHLFLHSSCIALSKLDFSSFIDDRQADLFGNECEGMCGV